MKNVYRKQVEKNQAPKRKKTNALPFIVGGLAILLCAGLVAFILLNNNNKKASKQPLPAETSILQSSAPSGGEEPIEENKPEPEPTEIRVSFSAVGDNLVHNGLYLQAQERANGNGYDFSYVFDNMSYFLDDFDVNWMNQETIVNDEIAPDTYPCFSTPGDMGRATYDAGWRVFSVSSNHTYDKFAPGISATLRFWESMPDDVVVPGLYSNNEDDSSIKMHTVNGMTIAYLSYTEFTNGIPTPEGAEAHVIFTSERDVMQRQIERASELADAVVVSLHWGVEGSHTVTQDQINLAQDVANWGATAIIGGHPHVIQPVGWVSSNDGREVPIVYSLGNFVSAQAEAQNMVGLAFCFDFVQTEYADGTRSAVTAENMKVYPTVTHYDANYANIRAYMLKDYTPELANSHGVRARNAFFSMEYIVSLVEEYIDEEYLVLE